MKRFAKALPLLTLALGAGCMLVSGQITFVQGFDDDTGTSGQQIHALSVDLNENEDYKDHKDEIKSLEAIGFVVKVTNLGNLQGRGRGYLSIEEIDISNMSPAALAAHPATHLILDIEEPLDPGETRKISFEESQDYIRDFKFIDQAVKDGEIYFYGITDIGQMAKWENLKIIATVNVEI